MARDGLVEVRTDTILSLPLNLWLSDLQHVHSVEGQRPPHAVHDRPDKYTRTIRRQHYYDVNPRYY